MRFVAPANGRNWHERTSRDVRYAIANWGKPGQPIRSRMTQTGYATFRKRSAFHSANRLYTS
jgi:hypothetical protein